MNINITTEDIINGTQQNCGKCPIARAINKISRNTCEVFNTIVCFYSDDGRYENTCFLPHNAMCFIGAFDRGEEVFPMSFEMDIPQTLLK